MDIRRIDERYAVSPQIDPHDVPAIAEAGYRTILCNRPDAEVPMELSADVMRTAAEAAGLRFVALPATHATITPDLVSEQKAALEEGPVLAYCASGTRSTIIWALGQRGERPAEEIVRMAGEAGYDLGGMRGALG